MIIGVPFSKHAYFTSRTKPFNSDRMKLPSYVGELLGVASVDLALALHLHPFVLLTVRDVEDQPGFQEKMTVFVESPQLAIRAPAFVLAFDDVKALWVEGDDQPLGKLYE